MTDELSRKLLQQDGLPAGGAPDAMLELLRSQQAKADARERFWFRMASGFWIVAGICFVVAVASLLSSVGMYSTMERRTAVAVPEVPAAKPPAVPAKPVKLEEKVAIESGFRFDTVIAAFVAAATILPVAILGGLFSSVWLMLTRRQASQATMQFTLAALTSEIRGNAQKSASS
ncbi:MAG TPA: hypothetical protein VHR72_15550 [Gemmataceae bacterium]|jgi:hypothetical protein|nr:hypothetical protein [Gemmataceae bacterium]